MNRERITGIDVIFFEFWGWLVSIIGGWPVGYPEVLDLQPFASSIHLASSPRMQANRSMLVLIHRERVWECNTYGWSIYQALMTYQDSIRPTRIPNWTFMLQDYIPKINRWDLHSYSIIHNLVSWEYFWVPDGLQLKKRECSPVDSWIWPGFSRCVSKKDHESDGTVEVPFLEPLPIYSYILLSSLFYNRVIFLLTPDKRYEICDIAFCLIFHTETKTHTSRKCMTLSALDSQFLKMMTMWCLQVLQTGLCNITDLYTRWLAPVQSAATKTKEDTM